jgi:DNA primase
MARGLLTPELKDEIRRRVDLLALIGQHVALKKAGRYYRGLCPFHQEKTPSFNVDPDRGLFHCFGCGVGGDIFDFVMRTGNLTFMEAADDLARRAGVSLETSPRAAERASEREAVLRALDAAAAYFRAMLAKRGERARAYLARRGVDDATASQFGLGYALPGWDGLLKTLGAQSMTPAVLEGAGLIAARQGGGGYFDMFRDRLIFPIVDLQGRVVAFGGRALDDATPKYLNSRESVAFTKGRLLYGLNVARDAARNSGEALVVEGFMDAVACHQFGFTNAVASLGTALTGDQVALLKRFASRVILLYDADRAGETAAERALTLCEEAELPARVAVLPAGQDPDGLLRGRGAEALKELLRGALPMFEYRVQRSVARHGAGTREGKLLAVDEVLTVIQSVANPVRVAEYLRALAERFDLPEDALRQRLRSQVRLGSPIRAEGAPAALRTERAREEAERLLLHVMVQETSRRGEILGAVGGARGFTVPAHRALADALEAEPDADVEALREQLDGDAALLLMRLAFEVPPLTDRDKDRAIADAARYLTHTEPAAEARRRMWHAIQAAQANGDEAELRRLQAAYAELITSGLRGE